jgi:hypothetical protein
MRHYVTKMARLDPGRPLLLKSPAYPARVGMLHATWPEARFIHIERDPPDVFVSTRRALRTVMAEMALQDASRGLIEEVVLEAYPRQAKSFREDAGKLPERMLASVRFEELERNPIAILHGIYRALGLERFEEARPRIEAYLDSIRDYRKSGERPRPEDVRAVERHWCAANPEGLRQ